MVSICASEVDNKQKHYIKNIKYVLFVVFPMKQHKIGTAVGAFQHDIEGECSCGLTK